jgi:WD40 repeat protein
MRCSVGLRGGLWAVVLFACSVSVLCVASLADAQDPTADDAGMADNGKPLLALDTGGHSNAVYKLMLNQYGDQLISVGLDKTIRIWDVHTGEPLRVLRPPIGPGTFGYLFAAALSPDGQTLAVGGYRALTPLYDHRVMLISLADGRMLHSLKGHAYAIYGLAFSPDGKQLASASHDSTLRIWNVETGQSIHTLKGHTNIVHGVAWSPDGKKIVSGSMDGTARIWSAEKGTTEVTLTGHQGDVLPVAWSPDGRSVATGCKDHQLRLFEPSGKFRYSWRTENEVQSISFSGDSKQILCTYGGNNIPIGATIYDMIDGRVRGRFKGHPNSPICSLLSPDGQTAVTGDSECYIYMWNAATGTALHRMSGKGKSMFAGGWSPDGQAIAFGQTQKIGVLLETLALERTFCLRTLEFGPPPNASFVRFRSTLGNMKIGVNSDGSEPRKVYVTLKDGSPVSSYTLPQPYDLVRSFSLVGGGRAAVGSNDYVRLFDITTGMQVQELQGRGGDVHVISPSPDMRYLLTGGNDQTLNIWKPDTGQLLLSLFFAGDEWIAWTPQGYYAASVAGESLMGWHINRGPENMAAYYPASQFHKTFYRPDVIRRIIEVGSLERAVQLADKQRQQESKAIVLTAALPPEVTVTASSGSQTTAQGSEYKIEATAKPAGESPVTALRLLVDGRPSGNVQDAGSSPAPETDRTVRGSWSVQLAPGNHRIAVKAETAQSYSVSEPVDVVVDSEKGEDAVQPTLYVLAVGVTSYPKDNKTLQHAAADAKSIAATLEAQGQPLFGKVVTKVLTDGQATREGILAGLEFLKKQATPQDTVVIFYSGQGARDATGGFHLVPSDGDAATASVSGISETQIKQLAQTTQGKLLLFLDARERRSDSREKTKTQQEKGFCYSSATAEETPPSGGASDRLLRDLISEDYGVSVIRATQGTEAAYESASQGQSTFTQAVLEALQGKADTNGDGVVHLNEVEKYITDRVKTLTGNHQHPSAGRPPLMRSFPLTKPGSPKPGG